MEKNKFLEKKLEIHMKQNEKNRTLSSWELTDYIDILTKSYYKNELLNSLKMYKYPENYDVIIFDDSFNIKKKYLNLDIIDLNFSEGAKRFYHLGSFSAMTPNSTTFMLNMLFEIFLKANEILVKENFPRMDKNKLNSFINVCMNPKTKRIDVEEKILIQIKSTLDSVKLSKNVDSKIKQRDAEARVKILKRTEKSIKNISAKYKFIEEEKNEYEETKYSIVTKEIYSNNQISDRIKNDYMRFSELFNRLQRPIIGILDYNKKTIDIICSDFIDKDQYNQQNPNFFDIKSITRNSPISLIFFFGLGASTLIWQILNIKKDKKIIENVIKKVSEKSREQVPYIQNEVNILTNQNVKNFTEQTEEYGFMNENSEVSIVKFTNENKIS